MLLVAWQYKPNDLLTTFCRVLHLEPRFNLCDFSLRMGKARSILRKTIIVFCRSQQYTGTF